MKTLALFSLFVLSVSAAQTVVPFASKENALELSLNNVSSIAIAAVTVTVADIPRWMAVDQNQKTISLAGHAQRRAVFAFSVGRDAPIGVEHEMAFKVSIPGGRSWTKTFAVSVAPPEESGLFQNYPNPFNAATAISYQLSAASRVRLQVYNLIGQTVATVVEGEKPAGYHQESWDASSLASGIYVYELTAIDGEGRRTISRRRMTILK